jgi:arylsulfatase A-like enzyme
MHRRLLSRAVPLPLVAAWVLVTASVLGSGCSSAPESSRPEESTGSALDAPLSNNGTNVLLVILDTVRADRFSCYGYPRPVTPNLDQLAASGVRFSRVYANASWTLPSHASLFTGTYAVAHQATQETLVLGDDLPTLAEIFDRAGYQTFGSSSNAVVSVASGLARGFTTFVEVFRGEQAARYQVDWRHPNNMAFASFLEHADRDRPFFAFLNYVEAHLPYQPPEPFRSKFLDPDVSADRVREAMRLRMRDHYLNPPGLTDAQFAVLNQLYDGEIAHLDLQVANLLQILQEDGRLANTLVIVASDHGENIGDHGHFGHVFSIYNSLLHVPLIVRFPDGRDAGEVRSDLAQLLDLFPTVLARCGIEYRGRFDGRDLFAPGAASVDRPAMAEYYYPRQVLSVFKTAELETHPDVFVPYMHRLRALQDGRFKLIWTSDGHEELYRIDEDPDESHDLLAADPNAAAAVRLRTELLELVDTHQGPVALKPPPPVGWMMPGFEETIDDPEQLERLRALGYVD